MSVLHHITLCSTSQVLPQLRATLSLEKAMFMQIPTVTSLCSDDHNHCCPMLFVSFHAGAYSLYLTCTIPSEDLWCLTATPCHHTHQRPRGKCICYIAFWSSSQPSSSDTSYLRYVATGSWFYGPGSVDGQNEVSDQPRFFFLHHDTKLTF